MRSIHSAVLLAAVAGLASSLMAAPPVPNVPAGNDIFGQPAQGPGEYPGTLSGATYYIELARNTVNGRFGSNALKHTAIYSGPMKWTAGNTNEGDLDVVIGPAQPNDPRSFPTWAGWDQYREDQGIFPCNPFPAALPLPASQWPDSENWGRIRLTGSLQKALPNFSWGTHPAHGVLIGTVAVNGKNNFNFDRYDRVTPLGTFYAHSHVSDDGGQSTGRGYNPITGNFQGTGLYISTFVVGERPGNQDEAVADVAVAYFPYEQGWLAGFYSDASLTPTWRVRDGLTCATPGLDASVVTPIDSADARHRINLPGASPASGMLLAQGAGDDNDESYIMGVLPEADGWQLAQRPDYNTDTTGLTFAPGSDLTRFTFVYVPYDAANLVGGQVLPTGSLAHSAGTFTVNHTAAGTYELSIPGKTNRDGTLLVTSAGALPGNSSIPDRTFFSWEFNSSTNKFVIQSRELVAGSNTWGEAYPLRDSGFYFVWVDFTNPPALNTCGCAADYNKDGGVDGGDIESFFSEWSNGVGCADVNQDGGIDGGDIESFFRVWENGGC
jgi:hypothetical protein